MIPRFRSGLATVLALSLVPTSIANAYPLDGEPSTGIGRLEAQRLVQIGERKGRKRPSGELLPLDKVDLRLTHLPDLELPQPDPKLTERVKRLLGPDAARYGISMLDLSDLSNIRYAEYNGNQKQSPGSTVLLLPLS